MPPQDDQQNTNVPDDNEQQFGEQPMTPPAPSDDSAAPAPETPVDQPVASNPSVEAWPPQDSQQGSDMPPVPGMDSEAPGESSADPVAPAAPEEPAESGAPEPDVPSQAVVGPEDGNNQPPTPQQ